MTESAVKSIMRLFAILGNIRSAHASEGSIDFEHTRNVTRSFLNQLTNPDKAARYLQIFEFHFRNLHRKRSETLEKKLSVFSVKIMLICEQLNESIDIYQKTFVLLQIFDILKNPDNTLSEYALDFLGTFSELLHIDPDDFDLMFLFVYGTLSHKARNTSFLIISGKQEKHLYRHHVYRENLKGTIVFFHHPRLNIYFFRTEDYDDGLALNAKPIEFGRIYLFEKGNAIRSPGIQVIHYTDIAANFLSRIRSTEIQFVAKGIEYRYKNSENGIKPFTFIGNSGDLIGIMGGSGVGKSTLLNILNGTLPPQKGQVLINGIDIYKNSDQVAGIIGFIPQDDFLIEELTVFENLLYNARFCFSQLSEEELTRKVDALLKDLALYEIRDLKVGTPLNKYISGGQRKRLNIALELLREPAILFVDEPTSGLSSNDSEKVMELLKQLTYQGKLVIVNIHQPSSSIFKMFDRLLVIDKGGHPVYFGNTIDSLSYFKNITQHINAEENECIWCGNINPEQILEIIEATRIDSKGYDTNQRIIKPEEWYRMYLQNIDSQLDCKSEEKPLPKINFKIPSKLKQFKLFIERNIKCKLADKQYLIINLFEAPLLAIILAFFTKYYSDNQHYIFGDNDNLPAFIFMSVVVALFLGMMVSAEEIIRDARQLKREAFLNLSRFSYLNSKVAYLFMISAIQMLVFVLVSHFILEVKGMWFSYWLILFATACFANMLGLNLSAGLKSVVAIYIFIPIMLIPQLLLSGTVVKFDKLHPWLSSGTYVPLIGDLIASRWAYEAITVNQFKNNRYEKLFFDLEQSESNATYCNNYWIPELLNKVEDCQKLLSQSNYKELSEQLEMLRNEADKLAKSLKITPFKFPELLTDSLFNEDAATKVANYFRYARNIATKILNNAIDERDKFTQKLTLKLGSHENLVMFKKQYYNEALAEQLLNKTEPRQIYEYKGSFYRKYEPVLFPSESDYGRAHYYAPVKRIGNYEIDTLIFNFLIIMLMTVILYIFLILDVLKKIISHFEKLPFLED